MMTELNSKHRRTLEAIHQQPTLANIRFSDIEGLFLALGAEMMEGNGSRVRFTLNGQRWTAHRPHPGQEARRYQVEEVRDFLTDQGVKP